MITESTRVPLIIQGYSTLIPAALDQPTNTIGNLPKGRGTIEHIDIIPGELVLALGVFVTVQIGAINIAQNVAASMFRYNVGPFIHKYINTCTEGGQTFVIGVNPAQQVNTDPQFESVVHFYFENPYDTKQFQDKLLSDILTLQRQSYFMDLTGFTTRQGSVDVTVPNDQGNVIGIQFTYEDAFQTGMIQTTFTVAVNGVACIINASTYLMMTACTRKGLVFPILIPRESTITLTVNDVVGTGNTGRFAMTLYFDDDKISR